MKKMFVVSFLFLATSVFGAGYDMRSSIDIENVFPPQTITASATHSEIAYMGNKSFLKIEDSVKGSVSVPVSVSVSRQSPYTGR